MCIRDSNSPMFALDNHRNECRMLVQRLWARFSSRMSLSEAEAKVLFDSFNFDRSKGLDVKELTALLTDFVQVYLSKLSNQRPLVQRNSKLSGQECSMLEEKLRKLTDPKRALKLAGTLLEKADSNQDKELDWDEFRPLLGFMYDVIGSSEYLGAHEGEKRKNSKAMDEDWFRSKPKSQPNSTDGKAAKPRRNSFEEAVAAADDPHRAVINAAVAGKDQWVDDVIVGDKPDEADNEVPFEDPFEDLDVQEDGSVQM
eukprot:TRINITY_DN6838_c0_g1_i5.p1 TRINITY_DN6838_c0_g1~~TRINITY_DN6838_c0_g1_i5.p1  ORF type:complete len:256 (-),score=90.37 TRINITY_DN6838_c0_g1_i5:132-899(-)